jgi:AmmeMemoRadiSam system protein B/AmmeMemoRadiSam system protein A
MVKEANVSGIFYAADPYALGAEIDSYIEAGQNPAVPGKVIGIIAPHAGYIYSGPIAGYAYRAIRDVNFSTVVVLAPSHYHPLNGISVYQGEAFATPLGNVGVERDSAAELLRLPFARDNAAVFEREHAIEVHLPFLYRIRPGVKIVPVICGRMDRDQMREFARVLLKMSREDSDMLILASTDLSHYHPYDEAVAIDARTVTAVEAGDVEQLWQYLSAEQCEACGHVPLTIFLEYMKLREGAIKVLDSRNSGDTAGDRDRVVGYMAAVGFVAARQPAVDSGRSTGREESGLTALHKKALLDIARTTLNEYLSTGKKPTIKVEDPALKQVQGAFVTLHKQGQLRGCIGNYGQEPLHETIVNMAVAAATEDPRFPPVTVPELAQIDIEISVLSPLQKVASADDVVFGKHGVVVRKGYRQGVFLPQVAEQMRDKDEFLSYLCAHKAGLPADAWKDPTTEILVFTADVFSEQDTND